MMHEPGKLRLSIDDDDKRTVTGADGLFTFKAGLNAERVVVAHEFGCAAAFLPALERKAIVLRPWGRIEGIVKSGKRMAANQTVGALGHSNSDLEQPVGFSYRTRTDQTGRFAFDRVPAGKHRLYRYARFYEGRPGRYGSSHDTEVEVRAGETAQVTIGGIGRPLVGRMTITPPGSRIDWTIDLHVLKERAQPERKYYFPVNEDGSFRVEDVPPGRYTLEATVTEPPRDPLSERRFLAEGKVIGALTRDVVVPLIPGGVSDLPLDLGTFELKIHQSESLRAQ